MAFSQFTLKSVKSEFGLEIIEDQRLFAAIAPSPVSDYLKTTLARFAPLALAINTEKARSEWIIAPIMAELREQAEQKVGLFSGTSWSVDPKLGLEGYCDYLVSLGPEQYYLAAPVVAVVEAKKEDIVGGLGQCLATMYAADLFNKREGNEISRIYGAVTTGSIWKFLMLEGSRGFVDVDEHYMHQIERLMGILTSFTKPQGQASGMVLSGVS